MASERTRKTSSSSGRKAPAESSRAQPPELTPKQAAFVREYLVDSNGKQAAIRAGYAAASAEVTASKLLRNPKVSAAVEVGRGAINAAVQQNVVVEVAEVLRELRHIAFSDIGEAVGEGGAMLSLKSMSPAMRRAISSIEVEALFEGRGEERVQVGTLTKVKLWPKDRALELLGKYLKMFTDKVDLGVDLKLSHEDALGALE